MEAAHASNGGDAQGQGGDFVPPPYDFIDDGGSYAPQVCPPSHRYCCVRVRVRVRVRGCGVSSTQCLGASRGWLLFSPLRCTLLGWEDTEGILGVQLGQDSVASVWYPAHMVWECTEFQLAQPGHVYGRTRGVRG